MTGLTLAIVYIAVALLIFWYLRKLPTSTRDGDTTGEDAIIAAAWLLVLLIFIVMTAYGKAKNLRAG
jgi:hypothetical protein